MPLRDFPQCCGKCKHWDRSKSEEGFSWDNDPTTLHFCSHTSAGFTGFDWGCGCKSFEAGSMLNLPSESAETSIVYVSKMTFDDAW